MFTFSATVIVWIDQDSCSVLNWARRLVLIENRVNRQNSTFHLNIFPG
jgi:hypothetical protein